jgi:large subunit ribosomal protein L9
MKVLLLADVYKHGVAGEVVDVADGFARNWLLPKKLGVKATPGALRQAEDLRSQADARRAQLDHRLNELAHMINGVELFFGRRASPTGKLFGSVTTSEIADALNEKTGIDINRRRISQTTLREVGTHEVPVRLGTEISPMIKVTIVREEDFPRYMAARAAQEASLGDAVGELASAVAAGVAETVEHAAEGVAHVVESAAEGVAHVVENVVDAVKNVLPHGEETDDSTPDEETPASE